MPNAIKILERIQQIDLEISAIEEEERGLHLQAERVSGEMKGVEGEIEALRSEIEHINAAKREANERIAQCASRISRAEERLREIKNDRELKALSKEKNDANKARKQIESELSELDKRLGEKNADVEAKSTEAEGQKAVLGNIAAELEGRKAGWEEALGRKQGDKEALSIDVSPSILKRYEEIKARRGGRAVVPVRDEACQGCYIHIPPQISIVLKRGDDELIPCPHCHRILYVEDQAAPEAV